MEESEQPAYNSDTSSSPYVSDTTDESERDSEK